jgi:hypothetical protein
LFSLDVTVLDPETKEWIQLVLNALTAFGTLAAVVVALRLATRERTEIVRGRAGERLIMQMGMRADEGTPIVNVEVTNLTPRPVTISNLGWRVGIFRRQCFVQIPDFRDPLSFKLPTKLDYGERANYTFPRDEFLANASPVCSHISTIWPWLSQRFIFLEVSTSGLPGYFRFRVEHPLAKSLLLRAKEIKSAKTSNQPMQRTAPRSDA